MLLYHAEAELERAQTRATVVALVILAIVGLALVGGARRFAPPGRATKASLVIAMVGIGAYLVYRLVPESWDAAWRLAVASALFVTQLGAPLLALPISAAAYLTGRGRLAAAALLLSLVLPALFVAWMVACGVTDACFH